MRCITCEQPPMNKEGWFCAECYRAYRRTQHAKYASGEKNVEWGANRVRRTLLAEIHRLEQAQQARTTAFEERNEAVQEAFQRGVDAMRAAVELYCTTAIEAAERTYTKEFFLKALLVFRSVPYPADTTFGEPKQAQS